MVAFVIVLQVVVALFLIGVVLLQPGNRGGASAALGGAGSDTVFGARGANTFLSKLTFGAAVCFMVTNFAISFAFSSDNGQKSVFDKNPVPAKTAPAPDAANSEAPPAPDAAPAAPADVNTKPVGGEGVVAPKGDAPADEAQPNE